MGWALGAILGALLAVTVPSVSGTAAGAAVFEGPGCIEIVRKTMGATNAANAEPGTIRGDLAISMRNLIHGSDSAESSQREIALYFGEAALHSYERDVDRWIVHLEPKQSVGSQSRHGVDAAAIAARAQNPGLSCGARGAGRT